VFLGCFSKEWSRLQFKYLQLNNLPHEKRQAETQIRHLITYLVEIVHAVWLSRNKAIHGDDTTTQLLSYKHTQLLLEIQDMYDQQPQMLAADRRLFTKPYEYWIGQPTSQLKTFLQRMRATVKASIAQADDLGTHFWPIDAYFPPAIPPRHPVHTSRARLGDNDRGTVPSTLFNPLIAAQAASLLTPERCAEEASSCNVATWLLWLWTG
jgi:hypothetical protein